MPDSLLQKIVDIFPDDEQIAKFVTDIDKVFPRKVNRLNRYKNYKYFYDFFLLNKGKGKRKLWKRSL